MDADNRQQLDGAIALSGYLIGAAGILGGLLYLWGVIFGA